MRVIDFIVILATTAIKFGMKFDWTIWLIVTAAALIVGRLLVGERL